MNELLKHSLFRHTFLTILLNGQGSKFNHLHVAQYFADERTQSSLKSWMEKQRRLHLLQKKSWIFADERTPW